MIREFIVHNGPIIILALFLLFVSLKWVKLVKLRKIDNKSGILIRSLFPYSKQSIKNTFHHKLEGYYKYSNKANYIFYPILGLFIFVYFLMSSL